MSPNLEQNRQNGNAADYFVDRHREASASKQIAFVEGHAGGRCLTYEQLAAQSDQLAALYERHDLQREDRVVMLVLDVVEFPVIFWGSLKAGIIPVPLNTLLSTEIYKVILNDCRARALFISKQLLPVVAPLLKENIYLKSIFVVGDDMPLAGQFAFSDELEKSELRTLVQASPDETAFWLYSSGSTGEPKGVCHVHASLKATADTYGQQVLKIKQDDVIFSAAKMFFAYGLGNSMTFPMSVGATTVLLPDRPTPHSVVTVMDHTNPTIFCGVPTLYAAMLADFKNQKPACLKKLRRSISAGEALPGDIAIRWEKLTGSEVLDGVGSTEMLHIFLSNAPGEVVPGTSGVAVPGYEVRLINDSGEEVATGEIGELLVKGASAAACYWNQYDRSRETFEGVWTRTGDKYERDESGRYIYCGRTDDMFKVSGIWVSPFEVEQALASHPRVLEAAVVAARDDDGLEKPKAFVVLSDGDKNDASLLVQLKEHVKEKVGKWKYPRWIEITEELPKTATGKIQRFKLRDS